MADKLVMIKGDELSFEGFKVVQVVPQTQRHLVFLNELMNMPNHKFVEFWSKPSGIGKPCDILLSPDSFGSITSSLSSHGLGWTVTIQNVENEVEAQLSPAKSGAQRSNGTVPLW